MALGPEIMSLNIEVSILGVLNVVEGRSLPLGMAPLSSGHIPDPLKLFVMVEGFKDSSQASLKTPAKLYLFTTSPVVMNFRTDLFS